MVIGSVLLQPQRLQRASTRSASDALMDDLLSLAMCLAIDATQGAPVLTKMSDGVETAVETMLDEHSAGINAAAQRFSVLFETAAARVEALIAEGLDEASDFVSLLQQLLEALVGATASLAPGPFRQRIAELFEIVEVDLGITPTYIEERVWRVFDAMILALAQPPDEETPQQRSNRRESVHLLRRIKRHLQQTFSFPRFSADLFADVLLSLMQKFGIDRTAAQAACTGQGLAAYFNVGTSLLDVITYNPGPAFGTGGMGAAASAQAREQYCWYATWLLEYNNHNSDLGTLPAATADNLFDGYASQALRDAFRNLSVVLARSANVLTVTENQEWKLIDRKKYLVERVTSSRLIVYRLLEMSEGDFLDAIQGDQSELRQFFRENGILLASDVTVVHETGSNLWEIDSGAYTFRAFRFSGTITIHPANPLGVLFEIDGALIGDLDQRRLSDSLVSAFDQKDTPLTPKAGITVREAGRLWLLEDGEYDYKIEKAGEQYKVSMGNAGGWIQMQIGWPEGDKVWVNRECTKVMLGQRILHMGADVHWYDAPVFQSGSLRYSFKLAPPELMEHFAFHSAWAHDAFNTLFHIISAVDPGDIVSNVVNAAWYLYEMIMKLALHRPSSDVIGYWWNWIIPLLGTILASLEGMHTKVSPGNWFLYWACILLSTDLGEKALYSYWLSLARNLFLSSATLLNQDTEASGTKPLNHQQIDAWVNGFVDLSLFVLAHAIPRDKYTYPFEDAEMTAGYWIGGGLGVGLVGGLLGATAAAGFARGTFEGGNYLKASIKGLIGGLIRFWPMVFLVKEGDTAGGTYNPNGANFPGYPAGGAASPYNMPYPAGVSVNWGQCNQGMFSHHDYTSNLPQVYAFDLAMDQGDVVVAMRPGTIVDYFDWIPDDVDPDATQQAAAQTAAIASGLTVAGQTTGPSWNFVAIRHDRDEAGALLANPINAAYDRDQGGALTVTYAYYGHGRQGSVRSTFAALGIAGNNIIGQPIRRGQAIMLAGDTGRSFHNHLHIHVRPGPAVGGFSTDPGGGTGTANRTIPFVFRERDSVPTLLNSYTSQNTPPT